MAAGAGERFLDAEVVSRQDGLRDGTVSPSASYSHQVHAAASFVVVHGVYKDRGILKLSPRSLIGCFCGVNAHQKIFSASMGKEKTSLYGRKAIVGRRFGLKVL
jgi:hypothetical protein